jgi:hypothetical protein
VFLKRNSFSGDAQMNKDNFEGGVRSAVGQGERFVGSATDDKASEASAVASATCTVDSMSGRTWEPPGTRSITSSSLSSIASESFRPCFHFHLFEIAKVHS